MFKISFVCLGNICRSPLAHAIMEHLITKENLEDKIKVESCGSASYHIGEQADSRMIQTARKNGIVLDHSARALSRREITENDLLLAMDRTVYEAVLRKTDNEDESKKVKLFREFDPEPGDYEVPDPYYGGMDGFDEVFTICMRTCKALLEKIKSEV